MAIGLFQVVFIAGIENIVTGIPSQNRGRIISRQRNRISRNNRFEEYINP